MLIVACDVTEPDRPDPDPDPDPIPTAPITDWEIVVDNDLNDVSLLDSANGFAVGSRGTILRLTDGEWSAMESGVSADLYAVWAASPTDVYAGGNGGVLLHYDGQTWQIGANPGVAFRVDGLWGSSATDVWAVGHVPNTHSPTLIQHFDGASWSPVTSSAIGSGGLSSVWGSAAADVYAVGGAGTYHYDGVEWTRITAITGQMWDVSGSSSNDVYVAGPVGIRRWDGVAWSAPMGPSGAYSVSDGVGGLHVLALPPASLERGLYRYDGGEWSLVLRTDTILVADAHLRELDAKASTTLAVGTASSILKSHGSTWTVEAAGVTRELFSVGGSSSSNVYAGGAGVILHFDGSVWRTIRSGGQEFYLGVAASDDEAWFARSGEYSILHYESGAWDSVEIGASYLSDIWRAANGEIFAVGGEVVAHFDGVQWSRMTVPEELADLQSVWGRGPDDVFAAGAGQIFHYDGVAWDPMDIPETPASIPDITGFGEGRVYAAAIDGSILAYDDTSWVRAHLLDDAPNGITGTAANDFYAIVGTSVLHFDGMEFGPVATADDALLAIWSASPDTVFAVGNGGVRIRGTR